MELKEKTIKKTSIYQGRVINVSLDDVLLPNGKVAKREIVEHRGGVGIVAVMDDYIYLVKQFRYAFNDVLLEIPAGKIEKGEDYFETAKRELKEEIGATANKWNYMGEFYPTVGYCQEKIQLYLATELSFGENNLDPDEFLDVCKMKISECRKKIENQEIKDAKTIIGILRLGEFYAK